MNQPAQSCKDFLKPENKESVAEYHALPIANPRSVEEIENGIWTLTLSASRRIFLRNNKHKAGKTLVIGRCNRLKWIKARSCVVSNVGKKEVTK